MPLILAWSLSVHKSQGQTLERVKVDLRRTFEKGQGEYPVWLPIDYFTDTPKLMSLFPARQVWNHCKFSILVLRSELPPNQVCILL